MLVTIDYIANACSANVFGNLKITQQHIKYVLTDSRKLISPDDTIFFAINSEKTNAHVFIPELYQKGVRAFVVTENVSLLSKNFPEAIFLYVDSSIEALQAFARIYREQFKIPFIAITGSNGKTIVKEWLFSLISQKLCCFRSPKSFNSQIGVPLSIFLIDYFHKIAIIEAGISKPGEMNKLENIIKPDIGIFTNIGPAHNENFNSLSQKINEKLKLFKNVKKLIFSSLNSELYEHIVSYDYTSKPEFFSWGKNNDDYVRIKEINHSTSSTSITVLHKQHTYSFSIPFTDDASIENSMHCFTTMLVLGFDVNEVCSFMSHLQPLAMRLELHKGINNCLIINDSYNSDLYSFTIALDFLLQQKQNRRSVVFLSDMLQTGLPPETLYTEIASLLKNKTIDKFYGIGINLSRNKNLFHDIKEKHFFTDTNSAIEQIDFNSFSNEIILIKGARIFRFEKIFEKLQEKSHQTVLEINLNAIVNNLNIFKTFLKPETKIMVMVKAFSYGSGSYEIASLLQYHNVDYLGVAYADEGVELRKKGITLPIMVMAPEENATDKIIEFNLEPEIYSLHTLQLFSKYRDKKIKIHLKLDTGMHRLGFQEEDLPSLISKLKRMNNVEVVSIFTHLAVADDIYEKKFTTKQFENFDKMYEKISSALGYSPIRHVLNSSGIINYPERQYEMVRLGIGLYGMKTNENLNISLQNVASLKTKIIQIKAVKKGERIGYGNHAIAKGNLKIAIVPIGYADGFSSSLSNGVGRMFINGKEARVIGKVCMDLTILDITNIEAEVGDEAIIFDENFTCQMFANKLGISPYEVITNISQRVKRKYVYE